MTEQVPNSWVVAAESASLCYPGSAPPGALVGVDLAVGRGELVAITGRSGSGKSSLLSLLGLLEQPTAGEICFDGEPTSGMSDRERAGIRSRRLGFVFQDHLVAPHLTVRENLELALVQRRVARRHRSRAGWPQSPASRCGRRPPACGGPWLRPPGSRAR